MDPGRRADRGLKNDGAGRRWTIIGLVLMAILLSGVVALARAVSARAGVVQIDAQVSQAFQALRTPALDVAATVLTLFGESRVAVTATILLVAWLVWRGRRRWALGLFAVMATVRIVVPLLKTIFQVARPLDLYSGVDSFSFPSGHATTAAALYGFLALMTAAMTRRRTGFAALAGAGALIVLVAVSRVYLGAHWPSDVTAGALIGLTAAIGWAMALRVRRHSPADPREPAAPWVIVLVCALAWTPAVLHRAGKLYGPAPVSAGPAPHN